MEAERLELLEARVQLLSEVLREVISAIARIDEAQGKRLTAIAVEGLLAQSKQLAQEAQALPAADSAQTPAEGDEP